MRILDHLDFLQTQNFQKHFLIVYIIVLFIVVLYMLALFLYVLGDKGLCLIEMYTPLNS